MLRDEVPAATLRRSRDEVTTYVIQHVAPQVLAAGQCVERALREVPGAVLDEALERVRKRLVPDLVKSHSRQLVQRERLHVEDGEGAMVARLERLARPRRSFVPTVAALVLLAALAPARRASGEHRGKRH